MKDNQSTNEARLTIFGKIQFVIWYFVKGIGWAALWLGIVMIVYLDTKLISELDHDGFNVYLVILLLPAAALVVWRVTTGVLYSFSYTVRLDYDRVVITTRRGAQVEFHTADVVRYIRGFVNIHMTILPDRKIKMRTHLDDASRIMNTIRRNSGFINLPQRGQYCHRLTPYGVVKVVVSKKLDLGLTVFGILLQIYYSTLDLPFYYLYPAIWIGLVVIIYDLYKICIYYTIVYQGTTLTIINQKGMLPIVVQLGEIVKINESSRDFVVLTLADTTTIKLRRNVQNFKMILNAMKCYGRL